MSTKRVTTAMGFLVNGFRAKGGFLQETTPESSMLDKMDALVEWAEVFAFFEYEFDQHGFVYPGVLHYEVTEVWGEVLANRTRATGTKVRVTAQLLRVLSYEFIMFFSEGASDDEFRDIDTTINDLYREAVKRFIDKVSPLEVHKQ